ncbi:hypothetical protein Micbo1qcDRAFT_167688, partial [Microdochium bolleyi]
MYLAEDDNGHNAVRDRLPALRILLEAGLAVDPRCPKTGATPLWTCAAARPYKQYATRTAAATTTTAPGGGLTRRAAAAQVARLLLEFGADVHFRHPQTWQTALMRAVKAGNEDCVSLLLSRASGSAD